MLISFRTDHLISIGAISWSSQTLYRMYSLLLLDIQDID